MTNKPFTAIVVSETHWDRAWYLPFQVYRFRLVRLIDRLIKLLDQNPDFHSFMLDGQMLPVEDYLAIKPAQKSNLERLVKANRLFVGPWYALADEYLVSPEALIRNLIIGTRMAHQMGAVMNEGYVPDSFGHIAQLPQILQGFGIESAIFWRGLGDEGEELGNEFWWQAPDGSQVLAIHLPDGYHNIANLGYHNRGADTTAMELNLDLAIQQVQTAIDLIKSRTHVKHLLLLNGVDHAEPDPALPEILAHVNAALPDTNIKHSTLPHYIAQVKAEIATQTLKTFQGEFNRGRYAHVLQSVYSTRMYLKQANEHIQTHLECYAEPFSTWAWLLGAEYPTHFLDLAWHTLLKNHPHDDICGCSVDAVHRENMTRFEEVEQIAATLTRDTYRLIMQHINRTAQPGVPIVIFNPTAWQRTETAEITLYFNQNNDIDGDFHLLNANGQHIPHQLISRTKSFEMEARKAKYQYATHIALNLEALPACGYRVYYALPGPPPSTQKKTSKASPLSGGIEGGQNGTLQTLPHGMENAHLKVEINFDGTLNILDKHTNRHYTNLAYFADDEDGGDEYDYAPCPNPQTISTLGQAAKIQLIQQGPLQISYRIEQTLTLPISLTEDRQHRHPHQKQCTLITTLNLRQHSQYIDMQTTVNNQVKDHRLRVCFPTNINTTQATADGHFDVVTRPIKNAPPETYKDWVQPPVPTHHQRYFVDVSDGKAGLAIFNRGLPEYEILPNKGHNTIAITLLRCVDIIFRDNIPTRPGFAGLPSPTPEAQCLGQHTFKYAIAPHSGSWQTIYQTAYTYRTPVYVRRGDEREGLIPHQAYPADHPQYHEMHPQMPLKPLNLSGHLPAQHSFLTLHPQTLALSAIKRAEGDNCLIVRLYNPIQQATTATLTLFKAFQTAYLVTMNEEIITELPLKGQQVEFEIKGKQVITIALVPAPLN